MPIVCPRPAVLGLHASCRSAITLVALEHHTWVAGVGDRGEGGMHGIHASVMARGPVGAIERGVTKAIVLCDDLAKGGRAIQRHGQAGEVQPKASLPAVQHVIVAHDGADHARVCLAREERTRALLRAGDEAARLSVADGRVWIASIEGVSCLLRVEPRVRAADRQQHAL